MTLEHRYNRLFNSIRYFVTNTRKCDVEKLMNFLYMLDFEHYKETGRSVTQSAYCALPPGAVSPELYYALAAPAGTRTIFDDTLDMAAWRERGELAVTEAFDDNDLTPRQTRLLSTLTERFRHDGLLLKKVVCEPDGPWSKTFRGGSGMYACIRYELAADGLPNRQSILELAREYETNCLA